MPTQYKLEVFIPNPNGPGHFKGALAWIHGGKEGGEGWSRKCLRPVTLKLLMVIN